jgi:hypothetical protein
VTPRSQACDDDAGTVTHGAAIYQADRLVLRGSVARAAEGEEGWGAGFRRPPGEPRDSWPREAG